MSSRAHGGLEQFWSPGIAAGRTGWLVGGLAFVVYAATASPFAASHDAAQFHTLARTGGIAHAGYPTIVLLLQLAGQIPLGSLPLQANLVSALFGAIAVGLAGYAGTRLSRNPLAGGAAALGFALSLTLWQESSHAGVHAFTLALDAAILLGILRFALLPTRRLAASIGLLFGLALTSHLTCLGLVFPLLAGLVLVARRGELRAGHLGWATAGVCVGLLPFAYVLAMDQASQPMNYIRDTLDPVLVSFAGDHPTPRQRIDRFTWLLTARQYLADAGFHPLASLPQRFALLVADLALNEFPLFAFLLIGPGLVVLARRRDSVVLILGAWLAGSLLFVGVGAVAFMVRIFFLPGAFVATLALAAALAVAFRLGRRLGWIAAIVVVLAPLARATWSGPIPGVPRAGRFAAVARAWPHDWSPFERDRSWDRFGRGVMERLESRAVILTCWEEATTLRYFVYGEPLRPDVDVVYACKFAPRFQRILREFEAVGRPVYASYEPTAELLGGGTAERVWTHERGEVWRIHGPARAPAE